MTKIYNIEPKPYLKMTVKGIFSPQARKYHAYLEWLKARKFNFKDGDSVTFVLSMPKSWSKKKKEEHFGCYVKRKKWKDIDNLLKGVFDALPYDDGLVSHIGSVKKIWGNGGAIIIETTTE